MNRSHPPLRTEVLAGITTFLTMSYIVAVNPSILATEGTGMPFAGVMTATVLLAFAGTLLMGLYAKLPYGVAPGMGINAFFTYTLILGQGIPWRVALGLVFWAGVIFLIFSVLPVRRLIADAIPAGLRQASAVGIGLFLTFIGLKNSGLVVAHPVTLVQLGPVDQKVLLSLIGLVIMIYGLSKKSPWAFISGIAVVTFLAKMMGLVTLPDHFFSRPDFESVFFQLDFSGILKWSLLPAVIGICFTDLFDSLSTFLGISVATGMIDKDGKPLRLNQGLIVDALATLGAGLLGTSSGTAYIESTAGIEVGGRTGRTAIVCACCFLPFLFLSPLVAIIPAFATAPVLILVGAMMFRSVTSIKLERWEDLVPAFLTTALIPLTFSITQGMLWGFVSHVVLYYGAGRRREVSKTMAGIALLSIFLLWLEHTK